jgi:hypothetical protein
MTPALERLSELVRQAEAKTRARKIEGETQHAAEQFRAAELRARRAVEKLRVVRPASLRALEQADVDEQLLKDLVRKLALYKSSLVSEADAERLIAASQAEIERTRRQSRTDLEEISRDVEEARRELRSATDSYRQLRREIDRLQPELAARFGAEDRLLWDAEAHFPGGQLQLLGQEVDGGLSAFGSLKKHEQYARLKVWIGRFRYYQASQDKEAELSEEIQALSHRVFHQLKWLSRQYEPGYIEAFRQDYSTDWSVYVVEAQEQLFQAIEASRRVRDTELQPMHDPVQELQQDEKQPLSFDAVSLTHTAAVPSSASREPCLASPAASSASPAPHYASSASLSKLKALVARVHLPNEGLDQFLTALKQAVDDVGATHPELLRLVWPYREYISSDDGLTALKRNLERIEERRDAIE